MKGMTMKQKWALHRRGGRSKPRTSKAKATKRRSYSRAASTPRTKKGWGIGRYIGAFRYIDAISAPAQGSVQVHGFTKDTLKNLERRYLPKMGSDFASWKAIGTGSISTYLKSRMGVYRGAGKGKILSLVQALSPEILALQHADPTKNPKDYNIHRHAYASGYHIKDIKFSLNPKDALGQRFWADKSFNIVLGVIQKFIFNTNGPIKLNSKLPKGFNF